MAYKTDRAKLLSRWEALKSERSSWIEHWQSLSTYVQPRLGRFFVSDRNKGQRRNENIYDSTATKALKALASGLLAGATSPARPWFKLKTADKDLNALPSVKVWLSDVTDLMLSIFAKSNVYRALYGTYEELGQFGTAPSIVMPDFENVIHLLPLTVGEYAIASDFKGNVNALYREFDMTVAAIVGEYGLDACSQSVQSLYKAGTLDAWVTLIHAVEPRTDRDAGKRDSKNMPWSSCTFERDGGSNDKVLREGGFREFPILCPRWTITSGDIYGQSPAMDALGDIKQLQHEQLRKAQCIDYQTNPPLQAPSSMKDQIVDTLPGGLSFYDQVSPSAGIKSLWDVRLDMQHLLIDIQDVRERIKGAFYSDLFMMLTSMPIARMTATEVAERHEEKLLMLGPVLERLHNELLSPLVQHTFRRALDAGIVPQPPKELLQVELSIEFVSVLAQAQRAIGANGVDRLLGNVGAIAQYRPEVLDKVDWDYWVDDYSDMMGVDPRLIVPTEKANEARMARVQQAQQAEQLAQAEQASKVAGNLAGTSMGEDSVLANVLDQFTGYGTPSVVE